MQPLFQVIAYIVYTVKLLPYKLLYLHTRSKCSIKCSSRTLWQSFPRYSTVCQLGIHSYI